MAIVTVDQAPFFVNVYKRKFRIVVEGNLCSHYYDSLYEARVALSSFKFGRDTANWTVEIIEIAYNIDGNSYIRSRLEGLLCNHGSEEIDVAGEIMNGVWIAVQWVFDKATELIGIVVEELFRAAVDIGISIITKIIALL